MGEVPEELPDFRGPGAPSKFSEERAERLLQAVRGGNYLKTACAFAGVDYTTLRRWVHKADEPSAPQEYRDFRDALEKARADAEVASLAKIHKAANEGQWQAAAWFLERSMPDRWAKKDRTQIEVTGEGGGPVKIVSGIELDPEAMSALARRLQARAVEGDAEDIVDAEVIEATAAPDSPAAIGEGWLKDEPETEDPEVEDE